MTTEKVHVWMHGTMLQFGFNIYMKNEALWACLPPPWWTQDGSCSCSLWGSPWCQPRSDRWPSWCNPSVGSPRTRWDTHKAGRQPQDADCDDSAVGARVFITHDKTITWRRFDSCGLFDQQARHKERGNALNTQRYLCLDLRYEKILLLLWECFPQQNKIYWIFCWWQNKAKCLFLKAKYVNNWNII